MHDSIRLESELRELLAAGQKLQAIKLYKDRTGAGLLDAKNAVDEFARSGSLPQSAATATGGDSLQAEVAALLQRGQKLQAVKLYKERTGVSLMEAKQAVERLAGERGATAAPVDERLAVELLPSLRMGDKREAIRIYQNRTGAGAREAKRAVAALARQHGMYDRESACLTTLLMLVVLALVILLAAGAALLVMG